MGLYLFISGKAWTDKQKAISDLFNDWQHRIGCHLQTWRHCAEKSLELFLYGPYANINQYHGCSGPSVCPPKTSRVVVLGLAFTVLVDDKIVPRTTLFFA